MREEIIYIDRHNTDSFKWDALEKLYGDKDMLAMWVADMDFKVPAAVREAQHKYVEMGAQGYYLTPESYYGAFIDWEKERHGHTVKREHIRWSPGVVAAFNWLVQILTEKDDAILLQMPVYHPFHFAVKDNERKLIGCPLVNENGRYSIDFAAFEAAVKENNVKMFILSSPHNPVGRVWTREELKTMLDICKENGVIVLSDEIHQDIVFAPHKHIPSASVGDYDDMLVTLTAPSKTFNLAACQNSFVIIPNDDIRKKFDDYTASIHVTGGTPFGYIAAEAAYRGGKGWLEGILEIIHGNYLYVKETLAKELPMAVVSPLEGTYLLWVDFGAYLKPEELKPFMQDKCKIAFNLGKIFGGDDTATFIRMNLATSRENVAEAVKRIVENMTCAY